MQEQSTLTGKETYCTSFIKDEVYDEPKAPRGINSYPDIIKMFVGPLVHAVDKATFKTRFFVKGTNPRKWPKMLKDLFGDEPVYSNDYTAFESHMSGYRAEIVKVWFGHMTSLCSDHAEARSVCLGLMSNRNVMDFKRMRVEVDERLMSGAMWTSSGNGIENLILTSYLVMRSKYPTMAPGELGLLAFSSFKGFVEGDDGICEYVPVDAALVERMGLKMDLQSYPKCEDAGFCSQYCEGDQIYCDPKRILRRFFYFTKKDLSRKEGYRLSLLRLKAMSYKHLYNDVPIVGPLMDWVLWRTRTYTVAGLPTVGVAWLFDMSDMKFDHTKKAEVSHASRVFVEKNFDISVGMQIYIESCMIYKGDCLEIDLRTLAKPEDLEHNWKYLWGQGTTAPHKFQMPDILPKTIQTVNALHKYVVVPLPEASTSAIRSMIESEIDNGPKCVFT